MVLKIVLQDVINGVNSDWSQKILNAIYDEDFVVDQTNLNDELLEELTLQVQRKCNYRKPTVNYFHSTDGMNWEYGVTCENDV